jgi:ribosomal protein S18 acetylase RimI-like enzyme/adenylylsulfate kinase-like enzyme
VPDVLILTGPPGAGKSSVAEALAERYDRVSIIEVDTLRHMITPTGFIGAGRPGFERQRRLGMRNACALALNFLAERFAVVIDDIVVSRDDLDLYRAALARANAPLHYVRLLPSLQACQTRNRQRSGSRVRPERVEAVCHEFESAGEIGGATIDSTSLSVYETADRVQALTTSGASLVGHGPEDVAIVPKTDEHRSWALGLLRDKWGSELVVTRRGSCDASQLPGFVALVHGSPSGLLTYRLEGESCEIVTLDSRLEGLGVGSALIEAVRKHAASRGCRRLHLTTTNDNLRALRFYQRRGFTIAGLYPGAVKAARLLKPEIPLHGNDGIEIRDEIELEMVL